MIKKRFQDFLFRLLRPGFWIQNYPTSYVWDEILNEALDRYPPARVDRFEVKIGAGLKVWVQNYPYAYGRPSGLYCLPRPKTRIRLRKLCGCDDSFDAQNASELREIRRRALGNK